MPELENLDVAPAGAASAMPPDLVAARAGDTWHPLLVAVMPVVAAVDGALFDAGGRQLTGPELAEGQELPLLFEGREVGTVRLPVRAPVPPLQHALDRLLREVEDVRGRPLRLLDRTDKQQVVAELDARGAFVLRKAVEDVADALGVSRFTIYNYLARAQEGAT